MTRPAPETLLKLATFVTPTSAAKRQGRRQKARNLRFFLTGRRFDTPA